MQGLPSGDTLLLIGIIVFVCFWIYSLLRVAKDITRRTAHTGTQLLSIVVIVLFTPLIGLPIYFLLRPIQRKETVLQQQTMNDYLQAQTIVCLSCGGANFHDHLFCVFCGEKIKQVCPRCKEWYGRSYQYCPYCAGASEPEKDVKTKT